MININKNELWPAAVWECITGVVIYDPDGWRKDGLPFDTPITRDDFESRMMSSTIMGLPRPDDGWRPGRWWSVYDADGKLWCETSSETEARWAVRPGDTLYRQWVRSESELREVRR